MKVITGLAIAFACLTGPAMAGQHVQTSTTFTVKLLVSDQPGKALVTDPDLKNPWGISQFPGGGLWVSDNRTGLSTIYDPNTGAKEDLVVTIPLGEPTGQVAVNAGNGFNVTKAGVTGESAFIFATQSGAIEGWSPSVDLNNAIVAYKDTGTPRHGGDDGSAGYTGLAYDPASNHLFAANFGKNTVEIFDNTFAKIAAFTDPNLPKGYAPFNVAVLNGELYVTFAKRKGDEEVEGKGLGYVDVFTTAGVFVKTLVANGPLNAPWGLVIAPANFGSFAGSLLVGNFGEGHINAFDTTSGTLLGTIETGKHKSFEVEGLWQLDDTGNGSVTFSAGLRHEKHGLIGLITPN